MAFTLHFASGEPETFPDDAIYRFNDRGLLIVVEASLRRRIFSPGAWTYIEDTRTKTAADTE